MGWAYLEVRKKTEEVRSKIRVGEINRTENGEMEKGKAKKSKDSALESAGKLKRHSPETRHSHQ